LATGYTIERSWADYCCKGEQAREVAQEHDITLRIAKLPEAKKGFVLWAKRWVSSIASVGRHAFGDCRAIA